MRRATATLLGLLLVLGSTSFGLVGHVHAAAADSASTGLHVDHVHSDSAQHAHHAHQADSARTREPALDHDGRDAIILRTREPAIDHDGRDAITLGTREPALDHDGRDAITLRTREPAIDHDGRDAITLGWVASQAMPKRLLPCLAAAPLFITAPHEPATRRVDPLGNPLADPPLHAGPPGRAPPA